MQVHRLKPCRPSAGHSGSSKDRGAEGSQAPDGMPVKGADKAVGKSADAATDMVT